MRTQAVFCVILLACHSPVLLVKGDASSELTAVQKAFFTWHEREQPEFATDVGGTKAYNDRLANLSTGVFDTRRAAVHGFIDTTSAIDRSQLKRQQQYSYDIFLDTLTTYTSNYEWRQYGPLNPVNFLEGFYLGLGYIIDITPFDTKGDYENYIARLEAYPTQIEQMMDRMREAIRLNRTNHLVSVNRVPDQISQVINTAPVQSPLYQPFNDTLDKLQLNQSDKNALQTQGSQAIGLVWTALDQLKTFIADVYNTHTRATYGVSGLDSGKEYYRACLAWHLSVHISPEEVHQTGLREVDRITQLMEQVIRRQGFNDTIAEYFNRLKSDPRFFKNSAEELLMYAEEIVNRTYTKLPKLFKDIPSSKVVVRALPFDGPAMYYSGSEDGSRPGVYYINVMRPNETDTFSLVALSLHEAAPGHHLQSVYQLAAGLPDFQKHINYNNYYQVPYHFPFYTAYTEGWGLYSEYLGEELGMYTDDYELMGRYGYEIFRACRLVVDTGLHYMGWTRERAIDYIHDRTHMSQADVEIEVDRYITWPGQACAYKIGELKIKELRKKAADALGSRFDVRDFHSLLLDNGPVPLRVIETIVNDYIADNKDTSTAGQTLPCLALYCICFIFLLFSQH